jgi:hypothetical protein
MSYDFLHRMFWLFLFGAACASPASGQQLLFPELVGWQITQSATVYDSTNLWDIIDGGADLYLHYGFVDLHLARYTGPDNIEVKAELYRHKSELLAFGIYSQERDTSYRFVQIGVQGYWQEGVLNFLSGVCYVKLSTHHSGEKPQAALQTVARAIAVHLHQNNSWPEILSKFPTEERIPNSEQFVSRGFLEMSCLRSVFTASYRRGFRMFVMEAETPLHAKAIAETCMGQTWPGPSTFRTPQHSLVTFVVVGRYVGGVVDCSDRKVREKYLKALVRKLLQ